MSEKELLAKAEEEILKIFTNATDSFKDNLTEKTLPYLKDKAKKIVKWRFDLMNAPTPSRKERAEANLLHLTAQAEGEVIRKEIAANKVAGAVLGKIISVVADTLLKIKL